MTEKVLGYFLIIIFPLVIILGNFKLLITDFSFYQSLYNKTGVYRDFGDKKVVDGATNNLFGYFWGKNMLDANFYSSQAISHLKDVRDLLIFTNGLFYISLFVVISFFIFLLVKKQKKIILKSLLLGSIATIIFIIFLGLGLANAFDAVFLKFHQALFANTLWLFPSGDNLIRLFPQQFFVDFANKLAVNIFGSAFLIAALSFRIDRHTYSCPLKNSSS